MTFGQHCAQLAAEKFFCTEEHRAPFAALIDREVKTWASSDDAQAQVDLGRRGKKIPPTYEDVAAYVLEINAKFDPQGFIDFYQAKGWVVGRAKMKDWCAAARMWKREDWGGPKGGSLAAKPNGPRPKLTEWERKQKVERMCSLRDELHALRYPGGSAYPVAISKEKQPLVARLQSDINEVQLELLQK